MCIPQSDGTGRGFSGHPYPKATKEPEYIMVEENSHWICRHKKSGQKVKIVGNRVTFVRETGWKPL